MTARLFATGLILFSLVRVTAQATAQSAADSVRSLDRAWAQAYANHDTALAASLFADDLVVTSSGGLLKDKAGELADVRPAAGLEMQFFRTSDVELRLREETAVVMGVAEWAFTLKGNRSQLRRRYTAVYVRGGPLRWQMLALHVGPAPEAPTTRQH